MNATLRIHGRDGPVDAGFIKESYMLRFLVVYYLLYVVLFKALALFFVFTLRDNPLRDTAFQGTDNSKPYCGRYY